MVEQHELEPEWTLVTDSRTMESAVEQLAAGVGAFGVDAERASGYRYGQDAFLVQVHRRGSGTFLFDPTTIDDFDPLSQVLHDQEWILHAASQDLTCLSSLGLEPDLLFDTELGSRLLGLERVGLSSISEELLGIRLQKAHSAADWSTRPLPESWLEYAALDVALLPDLRDAVAHHLEEQGKTEYARQEFESVRVRPPKPAPEQPWRRLSGGNRLKTPREWAVARELWEARDELARERDVAPGRLLPDLSLVTAAVSQPRSAGHLASMKEFTGRASRSELDRWWRAVVRGRTTENLPGPRPRDPDAIPHHRNWAEKHPHAAARLSAARAALLEEAERQNLPLENLLTPDILRRIAWDPPQPMTVDAVSERMSALGARPWQTLICAPIITAHFVVLD